MPLKQIYSFSGMSRRQLEDRLRIMEATETQIALEGPGTRRARPGEQILRKEKIAAYAAEIERRLQWEQEDAAATAAAIAEQAAPGARDNQAENENKPMNVRDFANAEREEWNDPDHIARREDERAAAADRRFQQQTCCDEQPDGTIRMRPHAPVIPAPQNPRLSVECPQCHAQPGESCTNYKGRRCHPHGQRKAPAVQLAKHQAKEAAAHRQAVVAAAAERSAAELAAAQPAPIAPQAAPDARDTIEAAAEAMLARWTLGEALDALWDADRRKWEARRQQSAADARRSA